MKIILKAFSILGFIELSENPETKTIETTNLTILNVFLVRLGPMREDSLVKVLISSQVCSIHSLEASDAHALIGHIRSLGVSWPLLCDTAWRGCCTMVTDGRERTPMASALQNLNYSYKHSKYVIQRFRVDSACATSSKDS